MNISTSTSIKTISDEVFNLFDMYEKDPEYLSVLDPNENPDLFEYKRITLSSRAYLKGFTALDLNSDNARNNISKINQVLIADDKSSIIIIRPDSNSNYDHAFINALTREGFDSKTINYILNTFVFNNLIYPQDKYRTFIAH
jgi:hypothetical protein